ncbi:hypothetical protein GCM10009616_13000 [Microlunatus lacustris]
MVRMPDAATVGPLDAVARARQLVGGCALLLVGDLDRADRLSQTVLARHALRSGEPSAVPALRGLVRPRPGDFEPPWLTGARVELRDTGPAPAAPSLLAELQALPADARAALVLSRYAGLTAVDVAAALDTSPATVGPWVDQAVGELAGRRPDRRQPSRLAEELAAAAAAAVVSGDVTTDRVHGRQLVRRRRLRRVSAAVAATLVLVLGASTLLDRGSGVPQAVSTPVGPVAEASATPTGPGPVTAVCDVSNPSCQASVMRRWRTEMSEVVASHLDPEGTYFSGYSFSYDERYESRTFWAGEDGALGLEVFRLDGGATEVYLQVASGYDTAIRCGETTKGRCEGQRFPDGHRFTLSTTTQVVRGIEVQHRPDGDQVVTVVARNTTRGRVLEVTRADLVALVQDPRLRLPVI